jgi:DNA primase
MDPQDNAKYLNSPETLLFDKGASLFNHGPARTAAGKGQPLIVAEGYMDVIALAEHGFEAAVAPLGTAITERQLQMLWRISPEPIIALDGDTAGLRAAMRLIDLALPLLTAGQSLRFALMPEGQDPDDLLRSRGAQSLQERLDQALPMVQLLWRRETEGRNFDSPERKAALDKALRDRCALIKDPNLRGHYEQALKDLKWELFRSRPSGRKWSSGAGMRRVSEAVRMSTKASALLSADMEHLREAVILAALATCPQVIDAVEAGVERMRCADAFHARLRDVLLAKGDASAEQMREEIARLCGEQALENLLGQSHVAIVPCIRTPGNPELVRMTVEDELAKLLAVRGLDAEIAEAEQDLVGPVDEGLTWRLSEAAQAAERARRSAREDRVEYEIGKNGARISRDERHALDALLQSIKGQKPLG